MTSGNTPSGNQDKPQRNAGRGNGERGAQARRSGQNDERSRSPESAPSDQTVPEQTYADYAENYDDNDAALNGKIPDVLIDAPVVSLKGLDFELDDLRARVSLLAKVLELVELSVGIDAHLSKVKLTIESIDVQALVKVRLDNVTAILDRVLTTVDRNPQIVEELTSGVGAAAKDVGEGAGQATQAAGEGAGQATERAGEGAGQAVQGVSDTADQASGQSGQAARGATDPAGQADGGAQGHSGQTAEGTAAPGLRVLSETTDEAGRTVRRAVEEAGSIIEQTLSESGDVLEETVVGEASTS